MSVFSKKEIARLKKLKDPRDIQTFINKIPINFEKEGETCKSPFETLKKQSAHCMEGALLACFIFSLNKQKSYLLHLKTIKGDLDHVICVFKKDRCFGAISKTNHSVLRYRDPVYKTIRELVMSYFHEYTDDKGKKTLRSYSDLIDLSKIKNWETAGEDLWYIDKMLDKVKHFEILKTKRGFLRNADPIEIKTGKILEWGK